MQLTHEFTVPTGVDEAWAHFQDIASVAQCFPGATVDSVDGDSFTGQVKVKLGPIALVYHGTGSFTERDESAHRFLVDAQGRDKRGNGTAGAKVTLTMTEAGASSTDVQVLTDLAITGKPAQFGRGVMQDVSDKLLGQFVQCLERRMASGERPTAVSAPSGGTPSGEAADTQTQAVAPPKTTELLAASGAPAVSAADRAPQAAGRHRADDAPVRRPDLAGVPLLALASSPPVKAADAAPEVEPRELPEEMQDSAGVAAVSAAQDSAEGVGSDDAIDLGATVLPVLLKSYGKQIAAGLVGAFVLRQAWRALTRR